LKNPSKESVTEVESLHASVDESYEEFVISQAKFEAAKTKFTRTLRKLKIECEVTDEWGLDYASAQWIPPKLQIPGQ
jgi:hypothetical protein